MQGRRLAAHIKTMQGLAAARPERAQRRSHQLRLHHLVDQGVVGRGRADLFVAEDGALAVGPAPVVARRVADASDQVRMQLAHAVLLGQIGGEDVVDERVHVSARDVELAHGNLAQERTVGGVDGVESRLACADRG